MNWKNLITKIKLKHYSDAADELFVDEDMIAASFPYVHMGSGLAVLRISEQRDRQ